MATITKPMALDESFNTTESTSRNQADVLAGIEQAIVRGFGQVADAVSYDNTDSGLTADNVQDAIDEVDDTVDGLVDDVTEISSDIESTQTVSGNPLTLTDCAPINAESLVVVLEPKQEGSGDPSPTNIRPITGYTECEVDDVGFNQWDEEWRNGYYDASGSFYTDANYLATQNPIPVKGNKTYYFYCNSGNFGRLVWTDIDGNFISSDVLQNKNFVRISPNNAMYLQFDMVGTYGNVYKHDISINYPSTVTTYQPYHSSNATIQFGQTVYGGIINFRTGECKVNRAKIVLDGTQTPIVANWNEQANTIGWLFAYADTQNKTVPYNVTPNLLCDKYKTLSYNEIYNHDVAGIGVYSADNIGLIIRQSDKTLNTASLVTAYLSNNPIEVCYELAEPFTIQLTPQELKLLKGTNNLTTNGTTINLGYQPDNVIGELKGEIEKCSPNPEFMHFEVNGNVVDAVPIIFDEAIHSYTVSGDNWKDKTFLCVECCDMRYGNLQLVLSSDMAFVDSCGKALLLYPYIRSVEQYIKITISLGQSYGYEISYQTTNTSSLLDYLKIRVRLFN